MIAAYGDRVVMEETLAEALSALFVDNGRRAGTPGATAESPGEGPAARRAKEALDHYNQAMERFKSGDWTGFGKEISVMRGLLEDIRRQSGSR